jgi:hypothetical protein
MARAGTRRRPIDPPVALATTPETMAPAPPPTDEERIARIAYERFLTRGGEHGHDQEDWFAAQREITGRSAD